MTIRKLILLFLAVLISPVQGQDSADDLLRQALDALAVQKASDALDLMSRFKQENPLDARGVYVTGMALALLERFGEAAAEFDQAIQLDPGNLEYRLKAALAQDRLGRPEQAIERLQIVDGQNLAQATSGKALWLLADLYFRQNRASDAERVLTRYRLVNPPDFRAQLRLGQIDLIEGRFEAALSKFLEVRDKASDAAPVHHALGLAQWRLNQHDQALSSFRRAVTAAPKNASFRLDLGRFLVETERTWQGLEELKQAQFLSPDNRDVTFQLARAYRALGDVEAAQAAMQKFQAAEPVVASNDSASRRVGSKMATVAELLPAGKVNEAHNLLLEIIEEDPDNISAHNYLAKIYISSQLFELATQHLNELKRLAPESFDVPFLTASFYYRSGQPDKALAPALAARDLRPDYADLRNLLGNIYFELGQRDLARQEYEAAVKLAPDRSEFQRNLRSVSNPN